MNKETISVLAALALTPTTAKPQTDLAHQLLASARNLRCSFDPGVATRLDVAWPPKTDRTPPGAYGGGAEAVNPPETRLV